MSLDKKWWQYLLGIWMTVVIILAFTLVQPVVKGLGQSVRILFFHVPCAWVATLAFLVSAVYSIRYLRNEDHNHDIMAYSAAHIGLLFTILATVTGAVWAQEIWGKAWNWDPRQISIFILMLIYAAYFALRSAVEEEEKQARLAAVYSIIAFVTVPFLMFIVPRIIDSLHPDPLINTDAKIKMETTMCYVFFASLAGFTAIFFWMLRLKVRVMQINRTLEIEQFNQEVR